MEFFYLLFAHFLGDMPLQGEWVAKEKGKEPLFMIGHCVIWTGLITLALEMIGITTSLWTVLFLFVGHYLADSLKCYLLSNKSIAKFIYGGKIQHDGERWNYLLTRGKTIAYMDQLFHLAQLLCVYFF